MINSKSNMLNINWKLFIWSQCSITSRNLICKFVSVKTSPRTLKSDLPKSKVKNFNFKNPVSSEKKPSSQMVLQSYDNDGNLTASMSN